MAIKTRLFKTHSPICDDVTRSFGERNQDRRRDQTSLGMVPSHKRFNLPERARRWL